MNTHSLDRSPIDSWEFILSDALREKHPYSWSLAGAVLLHITLLTLGGTIFISAPKYGIDLGQGGIEVQLIAAPVELKQIDKNIKQPVEQTDMDIVEDLRDEIALPINPRVQDNKQASQVESNAPLKVQNPAHKGDGSSAVAGQDATTFYSPGGAMMEGTEGYMKNPAPYYPQASIEAGHEGLVLVNALVNREGRVKEIALKESSGHPLLDKSALNTIKKWKFNPGRLGFLIHDSWITIPVRFRLENVQQA